MLLNAIGSRQDEATNMANEGRDDGRRSPESPRSHSGTSYGKDSIAKRNKRDFRGSDPYTMETTKSIVKVLVNAVLSLNNQHRQKKVDASKHVLETYHDSFLYGKVPPTVRVRAALRTGFIGHLWHFLEFFLALSSGVLYVYSTYNTTTPYNWVTRAQNYVSVAFVVDYILRVYSEALRLTYIFSFWGLIDLLSALPIIFLFKSAVTGGRILRLLQFLRIIRIISLMSKLGVVGSTVAQQILLLVISTFGAVFLIAGLIQFVEYYGATPSQQCPEQGCINFWDAFYFTIVTISTVGYGDITLKTQVGQLVAMIAIILALTILPIQIGRITYLASRRPYGAAFSGKKVVDSRYLIISGSVSFQAIQECLAEFYNPTHCEDLEVYPLRVTILAPFSPSFELKQLISLYHGLVEFIEGSPIRQSDLERVAAHRAAAFFLLADKEAEESDVLNLEDNPWETDGNMLLGTCHKDDQDQAVEDAAQIVKALAVHRYCQNKVRIIVEVLEPETQSSAVWDETESGGIEIICPIKVHYRLIARSCLVKGLYTFITNLFTSEIKMKKMPEHFFMSEYFHSFDNEVYPLIFPKACYGMLFEETVDGASCARMTENFDLNVVEFVFDNFNVILFALDVDVLHKEKGHSIRKVLLHPKGHVIRADDVGLVICWDLRSAYAISKSGDEQMEHKKWKKRKARSVIELQKYRRSAPTSVSGRTLNGGDGSVVYNADADIQEESIETRMRSAICSRYEGSTQGVDEAMEEGYGKSRSIDRESDSFEDSSTEDEGSYPQGMTLEKATESLLAWPPIPAHAQPHASVLERRADIILENLKERTVPVVNLMKPHILVCCQSNWPKHIYYFLKELRKPNFPNPPVVILHPNDPTASQWGKVGIFEDVFFLKGSPLYELDLMRGGVLQAEKVVVLGFQDTPVDLNGEKVEDRARAQRRIPSTQRSDVDNIVVAANVERLVGHKAEILIIDMQHTFAFYYLRPKLEIHKGQILRTDYQRNPDALVHFGPPFMEGKAVSPILLGFLLRSSFYNRNTISIVEQLIEGGYVETDGTLSHNELRVLNQIPVPEEYCNRSYNDLFIGLLRDKGILPLGLYRARGTLGSPTAYVFTNPPKETIVNLADLVYVLS